MLSARTFFHPRRRAWLPVAIAAGIALLPIIWYLASPLALTRAVSESAPVHTVEARLAAGQFGVVDGIHQGEGTASLLRLPDGCSFHPRCFIGDASCRLEFPPLLALSNDRSCACYKVAP